MDNILLLTAKANRGTSSPHLELLHLTLSDAVLVLVEVLSPVVIYCSSQLAEIQEEGHHGE